jgi:hypothetical protein
MQAGRPLPYVRAAIRQYALVQQGDSVNITKNGLLSSW